MAENVFRKSLKKCGRGGTTGRSLRERGIPGRTRMGRDGATGRCVKKCRKGGRTEWVRRAGRNEGDRTRSKRLFRVTGASKPNVMWERRFALAPARGGFPPPKILFLRIVLPHNLLRLFQPYHIIYYSIKLFHNHWYTPF